MKLENIKMQTYDVLEYGDMEIRNAISMEVGEILVEYKKKHGELPKECDEESIIGSIKIAMKAVENKKEDLEFAKKRRNKWIEIGKKLGVIEE